MEVEVLVLHFRGWYLIGGNTTLQSLLASISGRLNTIFQWAIIEAKGVGYIYLHIGGQMKLQGTGPGVAYLEGHFKSRSYILLLSHIYQHLSS